MYRCEEGKCEWQVIGVENCPGGDVIVWCQQCGAHAISQDDYTVPLVNGERATRIICAELPFGGN